ncbi:MAG: URC4/urg3 family protein [Pseudomonadota bacterium]
MTTTDSAAADTADWLLSPEAIRTQCGALYALAKAGDLAHFTLHPDRLDACAADVVSTMRTAYPDLDIPPHARWRHFVLAGRDRWAEIAATLDVPRIERARIECELAIVSVLLDAGAGASWRYRDPADAADFARSEGLALASLHMFAAGAFGDGRIGTTVERLSGFSADDLATGFQVAPDNRLEGLEGRAALIASLGSAVAARPDAFGTPPRLGNIVDHLAGLGGDTLPAREILRTVLDVLGSIWPDRPTMAGRVLGDCWAHPQAPSPGLVPFHKLSQWLSYSLIEPLQRAGLHVTELDALTGLAEYRNGGLFLDTGVLTLRDPDAAATAHAPDSALIVEWRALTVMLLDEVAGIVRRQLGMTAESLPLAAVLEGGTWSTGRRLARTLRPGGVPPLNIRSTGTVF